MKSLNYDLVIIGGGPAGLNAGIYAARAKLNVILIEKIVPGGQILLTDHIENFAGFPEGLSGSELIERMTDQTKKFDLKIEINEVISVDFSEPVKKIELSDRTITCHTVIIATGASPKKLGIPGESLFLGKGISFCATCDGPFYKNQIVAAVGGGDTAIQESIYLTKFAKKVYVIHRRDQLRATKILQERAFSNSKIEFIWDSVVTEIVGKNNIESITLTNLKNGQEKKLSVDGCFIWVGIIPNTNFLNNSLKLDESGFIITDTHMKTSVPGIFSAGDVRNTPLRQVSTSIGDGAIAVTSATHYIENLKE